MGHDPAIERHRDRTEHDQLDDVLQEQIRTAEQVHTQPRQVKIRHEAADEHVDHLDGQNGEAPEDEEVHPSRRFVALQRLFPDDKLALAEDILDDRLQALRNAVEARHWRHLHEHHEAAIERPRQHREAGGEHQCED